MEIEVITSLVSQVGFPIFVSVWLLIEGRSQNKNVVEALTKLENTINLIAYREDVRGVANGE